MKTIQDVRNKLAQEILDFQLFADLLPGGYRPEVALLDGKGKKIRKDAAADYWNPISGEISITFIKREDSEVSAEKSRIFADPAQTLASKQRRTVGQTKAQRNPVLSNTAVPAPVHAEAGAELPKDLVEAIKALDSAEQKVSFVSLKWFRDQFLPNFASFWAGTPGTNP